MLLYADSSFRRSQDAEFTDGLAISKVNTPIGNIRPNRLNSEAECTNGKAVGRPLVILAPYSRQRAPRPQLYRRPSRDPARSSITSASNCYNKSPSSDALAVRRLQEATVDCGPTRRIRPPRPVDLYTLADPPPSPPPEREWRLSWDEHSRLMRCSRELTRARRIVSG
ncbi:hypothetical protein PIB30_005410 [Stylosanthes scabra]|uniref:Uncharacterized protein n=1 Tax=Stylosanthes scabra TaxID=79078 RepID=A0ABU6X5I8_9FABA|nr:hypothetical protein [Stylosanthes scabra]